MSPKSWKSGLMQETSYGAQVHASFWPPIFWGVPYVGCMHPSVVAGLTTVSMLIGGTGPWPCWLWGPAQVALLGGAGFPSDCCGLLAGRASPQHEWARVRIPKWCFLVLVSIGQNEIPKVSATSISIPRGVPTASWFSWKLSKISKWVWPRCLSNYCLCAGTQCVRFCVCPLRVKCHFLQPSASPDRKPWWFSKPDVLGLIFRLQDPQGGECDVGFGPLALQEGTLWLWQPSHLWVTNMVWALTRLCLCPPTCLIVAPSLYL